MRLVVSDEEIRDGFRRRAAELHPDAGGDVGDFSELQKAQEVLLSPARRLKEWISAKGLESEARGEIDGSLMDFFQRISVVGSESEALIRENLKAQSVLVKAVIEVKLMAQREKVKELLAGIEREIGMREDEFPQIEEGEKDAGKVMRDLIFLEKWRATLRGLYSKLI